MNTNNPRKTKNGKFTSRVHTLYDLQGKNGEIITNRTEKQFVTLDAFYWKLIEERQYSPVYWH
jgi:uncharacterized GH25 family protein